MALSNLDIGKRTFELGLGDAVDTIGAVQIADKDLRILWMNAETALNEIQLFLEQKLGDEFFSPE